MPDLEQPEWVGKQETEAEEIFKLFPACTWEVRGTKIAIPISSIEEGYSNDIARHKRLFRKGERIDHLGGFSRTWTIASEFYNGAEDPITQGKYPDDVDALTESFAIKETGILTLPTRGPVTAVAWQYTRLESTDARDMAAVRLTFVEDFPDDDAASGWQAPQASSIASKYAADTQTSLAGAGLDGDPLGEIAAFADDLATLASAPGDFVASVEGQVGQAVKSIARTEEAFTSAASGGVTELATLLTDPSASRAGVMMRRLADTFGSARTNHTSPNVVAKIYATTVSIFAVAMDLKQDVIILMKLNSAIPNLAAIPAGTPIRVYAPGSVRRY